MDSGSTSGTGSQTDPVDISPVDDDLSGWELRDNPLFGLLDAEHLSPDEEISAPELRSATQSVARATDESSTTASLLDEPIPPLPIIDVHCHIHGVSLSRTKVSVKAFKHYSIYKGDDLNTEKKRAAYKKVMQDFREGEEEFSTHTKIKALAFGHWNFRDDPWVARKIIRSTQRFQDGTDRFEVGHKVAIVPMLLDFGYTPLKFSVASKASKMKASGNTMNEAKARTEEAQNTGIFYFSKSAASQKEHRFFTRDTGMFTHQIDVLHEMAKLYPGQIFPFCPYDPRRPDCLDHVKRAMDTQAYVGVKLYARCGWMPYGNAAIHGPDVGATLDGRLDALYTYVTANDIPILNHTSPTGHPPDGAIVYPWRMTSDASDDDRAAAAAFSPVGYPPAFWSRTGFEYVRNRTDQQKSIDKMKYELTEFGFYCLYDQLTTSPYAWETVLALYPKLRLCFAHFGSKLAVYANPRYRVTSDDAKQDCDALLVKNPMVAGATTNRSFKDYFVKGAIFYRSETKHISDDHAVESATTLLAPGTEWGNFLDKWAEKYPDDWSTRITKLVTKYENVYTDISFITGNGRSIQDIVGPVFEDALLQRDQGKRLFDKCMIGTDWYMTELAGLSPCGFWQIVEDACKMSKAYTDRMEEGERLKRMKVWQHWATYNAFRYLNIRKRFSDAGMTRLKTAYGCADKDLPSWWKTLEKFYDNPAAEAPPQ